MSTPRRAPSLLDSFNNALEGVIHVLRTQRNMRIHFLVAVVVLIVAFAAGVNNDELIALLLSNTAIESAVDTATTSFDPHAKLAKDIAAGAVLIATVNAVAVGYVVFARRLSKPGSNLIDRVRDAPIDLTVIALVVTMILVIGTKAFTGRGTPLRGGLPSGHAALAFAGWMAATYVLADTRHRFLISTLTFIMALLVAQTRVESGVHSTLEVAYGGLLGAIVTLVLFQAFT